MFNYENKSKP